MFVINLHSFVLSLFIISILSIAMLSFLTCISPVKKPETSLDDIHGIWLPEKGVGGVGNLIVDSQRKILIFSNDPAIEYHIVNVKEVGGRLNFTIVGSEVGWNYSFSFQKINDSLIEAIDENGNRHLHRRYSDELSNSPGGEK